MKQEVVRVFFAVAICPSVILLLASDHTHGLSISVESEKSSPCSLNGIYCSGHRSKVGQFNQVLTNGKEQFSADRKALNSSVDIAISSKFVENNTCTSTWLTPTSTGCECGSSLGGKVECNSSSGNVYLLACYLMTYSIDESMLVVGRSLFGCGKGVYPYYRLPSNTSKLNDFLCSKYHRRGQLCGRCEEEYAPPVYSYNLSCVKCTDHYANNWMKYLAVSLLPLTLFFIIIVTCRISVTSGVMNAFILLSQTISLPVISRTRYSLGLYNYGPAVSLLYSFCITLYGMWNLDFFRVLYPQFCLHPGTSTIQIIALDYVIAVYPLVLLMVAFLIVKLHDSKFISLWSPFHRCFVHFRNDLNIKTSLIDAFATFLILSYMKFLSVTFELLTPVRISNMYGLIQSKQYLYWDGTIRYFGSEHLPYAILALTVAIIFIYYSFASFMSLSL